jgi:hypothetical protein
MLSRFKEANFPSFKDGNRIQYGRGQRANSSASRWQRLKASTQYAPRRASLNEIEKKNREQKQSVHDFSFCYLRVTISLVARLPLALFF